MAFQGDGRGSRLGEKATGENENENETAMSNLPDPPGDTPLRLPSHGRRNAALTLFSRSRY
jgi:hypothetical protein